MSTAALTLSFNSNSEAADFFAALSSAFRAMAGAASAVLAPVQAATGGVAGCTATVDTAAVIPVSQSVIIDRDTEPKARKPRVKAEPAKTEPEAALPLETPVAEPAPVAKAPPAPAKPAKPAPVEAPAGTIDLATFRASWAVVLAKKGSSHGLKQLSEWSKRFGVPVKGGGDIPADRLAEAYADVRKTIADLEEEDAKKASK